MADLSEIVKVGKELGLEGPELRVYLEDRKREEQEKKREDQEYERERRAHEREMKRLEVELCDKQKVNDQSFLDSKPKEPYHKGPKLPGFEDSKDRIDSYLERFERYAVLQGWDRANMAIFLSALLTGKALDIYTSLPPEQAVDYDILKDSLLKAYQLTEDGFRKKFFEATPLREETPLQYSFRLETYLDKWIELSKTEKSYRSLRDLFVKEQFLSRVSRDLKVFVREHSPKNMEEVIRLTETFMDARGWRYIGLEKKSSDKQQTNLVSKAKLFERTEKPDQAPRSDVTCYRCQKVGHTARFCPNSKKTVAFASPLESKANKKPGSGGKLPCEHCSTADSGAINLNCGCNVPMIGNSCHNSFSSSLPVTYGKVGNCHVKVMRDTGCSTVVVKRSFVNDDQLTEIKQSYVMIDGTVRTAPIAHIQIETPYYSGTVEALCLENPVYDLIVGNIPGATIEAKTVTNKHVESQRPESISVDCVTNAVETRSASKQNKVVKPLKVPTINSQIGTVTFDKLKFEQESDAKVSRLRDLAQTKEVQKLRNGTVQYKIANGLLYRLFTQFEAAKPIKQLVVPSSLRKTVLQVGHDTIMSGHLGVTKTTDRILSNFHWPGITGDITRYVQSCDVCQKTLPRGRVPKAPVEKMPVIDTPFKKVAVDLIGPIEPRSKRGNRYILTLVDYATRYPEAVALSSIDTESVAEALVQIFSRIGVPVEVLSDNGSQFTSSMMKEVCKLLSIDRVTTSPYHAMANGLCEKWNGTLKQMLRKMCAERPSDWDRYLEPLLFAYREVPQASTLFSPFELVYGRTIRGPMALLRELWTNEESEETLRTTYEYVFELRNRLEDTVQLVHDNLTSAQQRYKVNFDRKAKKRHLESGSKVLVLLPTKSHKLLMQWRGPYEVVSKIGINDYRIKMDSKTKVFHVNMLKQYHERDSTTARSKKEHIPACVVAAIDEPEFSDQGDENLLTHFGSSSMEKHTDVNISDKLDEVEIRDVKLLIAEFSEIFSGKPGETTLIEHEIKLTSDVPIATKPYPVPYTLMDTVKSEIREMIDLAVIEPAISPYRFPLLLVRKKDGSLRPVIDFRKLNRVTIFDAEPMPNASEIYVKVSNSRFFTKLDFSKGYWQIPLSENSKDYTAFYTPFGLFRFRNMPFGLINSGSTYNRMMRMLLGDLDNVESFVDDVLIHSATWSEHLDLLRCVFQRIRDANLTIKPSKCFIGCPELEYVGHRIGSGGLETLHDKIEKIKSAERPKTKTELRSFLGLAGFYQKFVPHYSTIAAPLTDLTKKGNPNKLAWTDVHERSFLSLKESLCSAPVLRLPDFSKQFILRCDASNSGIGSVLLQDFEGQLHPIAYASRKLSDREQRYSVIEKECLAIVWSIDKFLTYLYGNPFILQTDHQPLAFLNKEKINNPRIMRWALFLQTMSFSVEVIKGKNNIGADYLSRT